VRGGVLEGILTLDEGVEGMRRFLLLMEEDDAANREERQFQK